MHIGYKFLLKLLTFASAKYHFTQCSANLNVTHLVRLKQVANASRRLTFELLLCRLAKLRDHLRDRCGRSLWLVKLDVVAALVGNQLLAMG